MNYDGPSFYRHSSVEIKNHRKLKEEKKAFIANPPIEQQINQKDFVNQPKIKKIPFKRKNTPDSLQKIGGWKKRKSNPELFLKLKERLVKKEEDYLLFANHVNGNKEQETEEKHNSQKRKEIIKKSKKKDKINTIKSSTGLHRSLSKIIAEDEEAMKHGKNNLDSLFHDF